MLCYGVGATVSHSRQNKMKTEYWERVITVQSLWQCVCACVPVWTEAGRSLEHSRGNMVFQHAYPPFPNKIWMHKRKKKKLSLSPLSGCQQPRTLSPGFAAVFLTWLQHHHAPQSVSVITVECRLLWRRLAAVTGFGMGACRESMETSRQVVTWQRVKQCDSITPFTHSVIIAKVW